VIFGGGLIFGTAMLLTGFVTDFYLLWLTYGVLGGMGIGAIYVCTVANTGKFFPDKKGLATGLVVAGFASGALFSANLATWLIDAYSVSKTFMMFGTAYIAIISFVSLTLVKTAPPGFVPAGWTPPAPATGVAPASVDKDWREMLSDPLFFVLFIAYCVACVAGLMFIAHAKPIAIEMFHATAALATTAVLFMAAANTGGRLFWGWVLDSVDRYKVLYTMFGISAVMLFLLTMIPPQPEYYWVYIIALVGVVLSFGGFMGCYPGITADAFGTKNLGMNYGIIFTAYGVGGIVGPWMAATAKEVNNGDYTLAFVIAGSFSLLGIALVFWAKKIAEKRKAIAA
jgi:OFA family oxalate/formate antiporter-like MFS transporter